MRAPLTLLWYGGPSNRNVLPRHGTGPVPQVVGGRLFILGGDTIQARDVFTGRKLWIRELPGIGEYYTNTFHQPGAEHVGSPYVSLDDGIYCIPGNARDTILRLDPATGQTVARFRSPAGPDGEHPGAGRRADP